MLVSASGEVLGEGGAGERCVAGQDAGRALERESWRAVLLELSVFEKVEA